MRAKELTINGTLYQYRQQYLKEDELWECAFVDVHGNMSEVDSGKLISYVEVLSVAKKELEGLIKDNEPEYDVANEVVLWKNLDAETQLKIRVLATKIQSEEMSEWHSYDEDYRKWRMRMHAYTGMWFTKSQYHNLYRRLYGKTILTG